jgi:hypothetical protein
MERRTPGEGDADGRRAREWSAGAIPGVSRNQARRDGKGCNFGSSAGGPALTGAGFSL